MSDVIDNYDSLLRSNFTDIIAVRDLYPSKYEDFSKVRRACRLSVKSSPINPFTVISTMEVETYFLSEEKHFQKIHPELTEDLIESEFNFKPSTCRSLEEDIHWPSETLDKIYQKVGHQYNKSPNGNTIKTTLNNLNYENLYLYCSDRVQSLATLTSLLEEIFVD